MVIAAPAHRRAGLAQEQEGPVMVVHYPPQRLRRTSDQPTAITGALVTTPPSTYRTGDIPLGLPTSSARTHHGLWALYPNGSEVVVVHPGGAIAGPPTEVARELARLAQHGRDEPDRAAARAFLPFLTDPDPAAGVQWPATRTRTWSRPAKGYWLSGPSNHPGQDGPAPLWPSIGMPARLPDPPLALPSRTPAHQTQPHPDPEPAPQQAA